MLALKASRLASPDSWRCKTDDKKRSMLGSWRDRKDLNETVDEKTFRETKMCGAMKAKIENWRSRKQENVKTLDESSVYGECMPSEWELGKLYRQMKIDNNQFITWLVESIYPCTDDLPPYITLSHKQAKGTTERDQKIPENAISFTAADHPKYEIIVNNFPQLARQINKASPTTLALLDRVIAQRSEYCYWMSRKSTDQFSQFAHQKHTYYIEVLKEVQTILAARIESETTTTRSPSPVSATDDASIEIPDTLLGKRKNSAANTQCLEQNKTAKTTNSTTTPKQVFRKEIRGATEAIKQQRDNWREAVANSCDKVVDKTCTALPKPMSYAGACRVVSIA